MITEHLETFAGLPIYSIEVNDEDEDLPDSLEDGVEDDAPQDPSQVAWRIAVEYEIPVEEFEAALETVLERTGPGGPGALVFGLWGEPYENKVPLSLLIERAERMSGLRSLFIGDMTYEECEISWIEQDDYTPLLAAFPQLERLWIRGGTGLTIQPVRHEGLIELVVQAGGIPPEFVRGIGGCELPQLEHLELWLGTDQYSGGATQDDLELILAGQGLPKLSRLGLRNAENADEVAAAVAGAPVVARLKELDLSLGTLGDVGANALLAGQSLTHLDKLDLHRHFISAEVLQRVVQALAPTPVDGSDVQTEEDTEVEQDRRFVSVAE